MRSIADMVGAHSCNTGGGNEAKMSRSASIKIR